MSMKRFYRDVSLLSLYSRACFIWFWVCRKKDLCLYIVFMPFLVIILCKTKCISHSKNQNFIGNENNENEFFTNSGSGSRYIFRGSGQKNIHNWMIYHVVFLFISLCSVLRVYIECYRPTRWTSNFFQLPGRKMLIPTSRLLQRIIRISLLFP